ncbi:MAG: response regulator [Verrucomicrobia bacterium]|nr:response regulator [Verrucomicrobiota bacterium]
MDDNPVVLKAFELKLKACGFEVSTTSNAAGVASIAEASGAELIILDINFPPGVALDWSGFTVMQWLRRFPELARIPVILISGDGSENNQQKSLTGGAVAFFQKPVPYPELLATIVRALRSPA